MSDQRSFIDQLFIAPDRKHHGLAAAYSRSCWHLGLHRASAIALPLIFCMAQASGQYSGGIGGGGTNSCLAAMVILPVELLHARVSCAGERPLLEWATASEFSNSHFIIERSADTEHWEEVGRVNGAGNSQQTIEYAWRDEAPLSASVVYYRLRQVDLDGHEEVLAVIPLEVCDTGDLALSVVPNPTNGPLEVQWSTANGSSPITELRLVDAQGRVLQELHVGHAAAPRWTIDLSALAPGTYVLLGMNASALRVASTRVLRH